MFQILALSEGHCERGNTLLRARTSSAVAGWLLSAPGVAG